MRWKVSLYGIVWDEQDDDLPINLAVSVEAASREEAIECAFEEATAEFGALVDGTEQIDVMPL